MGLQDFMRKGFALCSSCSIPGVLAALVSLFTALVYARLIHCRFNRWAPSSGTLLA